MTRPRVVLASGSEMAATDIDLHQAKPPTPLSFLMHRAGASVALTAQLERKAAMHSGQKRQPERGRALLAFNLAPVGVQHE